MREYFKISLNLGGIPKRRRRRLRGKMRPYLGILRLKLALEQNRIMDNVKRALHNLIVYGSTEI